MHNVVRMENSEVIVIKYYCNDCKYECIQGLYTFSYATLGLFHVHYDSQTNSASP